MELQTISQVTKNYNITTRMLRYYEQIGLLPSLKKEGYAYRTYDEDSLTRLEQILILRKLRIPLKEIEKILLSEESRTTVEIFQAKIKELSTEITALYTIKSVLDTFVSRLTENADVKMDPALLADESILRAIGSLPGMKHHLKEEPRMNDLNAADKNLSKLSDVRIVYLPPATVAAIHSVGGAPESDTGKELQKFMTEAKLASVKPDLRHYGFNHPVGSEHGYERWVTIPDDLEVPEPWVKKEFPGGLYAAHMIPMGNFEEWGWLIEWVENSGEYEANWSDSESMHGCLEEHLNYINLYPLTNEEVDKRIQLDLLVPIKPKSQ
ncbi:MerR family transcriptional regulator [Fontibacillus phaseoli]|uniref:MerR family transcriptional regulator n=1 Tax=Fontibacillus phaseoli TaxID=1416533 RepID=A0A369BB28_9BACL|nr:effector binding domain-containing protein [Fontibacillus phaseoli]RCX17707.1 MerR family transcriptional regulator [Fontibacillus phaseoli]